MNLDLLQCQDSFLFSTSRFPAFISAIGTGKTMCLLLKIKLFCEKYPDTLALIIRKEYTDLRDSTINDFQTYFNCSINVADKSFTFPNGSKILFRHGAELNVLKNLNLSIVGIEQAEEFEDEKTFDFLRDRLRRQNAPLRQLCIIANARGHNWIWNRWVNKAEDVQTLDASSGQFIFKKGEYHGVTANSFANEHNLPPDFISDLKAMETESPNHYKQYVMNSFEELEEDDLLFNFQELDTCRKLDILPHKGFGARIVGLDVARYGDDLCSASVIEQLTSNYWEEVHKERWRKVDLMDTVGRAIDLKARFEANLVIVDGDGLGAGVVDRLNEVTRDILEYRGGKPPANPKDHFNKRTEDYLNVKDLVQRRWLKLNDEGTIQQLMTIRYKFNSKGQKQILSKEDMRKKDVKSPDDADALMMACSEIKNINQYTGRRVTHNMSAKPEYSSSADLFKIGGIR